MITLRAFVKSNNQSVLSILGIETPGSDMGPGGDMSDEDRESMREQFENMSDEERESMRENIPDRGEAPQFN